MEERRKAFNARESLQDEYPTPEQRQRETSQAFAIVILSCMFLCVTVAWVVNMKARHNTPPVAESRSTERTIIGSSFVTREDTFATDKETGEKYYFVLQKDTRK